MRNDDKMKRFETLLSEFVDGGLDGDLRREFLDLLKSDPLLTNALVEQLTMDARLTQFESESHDADTFSGTLAATLAAEADADDFIEKVIQRAESETHSRGPKTRAVATGWWPLLAASTAAMIMLAIGWAIGNWMGEPDPARAELVQQSDDLDKTSEPMDSGVAVLVHAVDVQWQEDSPPEVGDILSPGPLQVKSGVLELKFYSGAKLVVEGPADLELVTAYKAICRKGQVRAKVPPAARGFSIVAPRFELVDLGTEFGLSVSADGESKVQVLDGEIELYPPGTKRSPNAARRLLGGEGVAWDAGGEKPLQETDIDAFPSFEEIQRRNDLASKKQIELWREWNEQLSDDPRVAFRYDFESEGQELLDKGPSAVHGAIVGGVWMKGRWPQTRALEFKRSSDRVRMNLPGSYDALTLSAWLRVDALPDRSQSLLLTDGYEVGCVHWHIAADGRLRLGTRIPSGTKRGHGATGYGTEPLITPRRLGVWCFACVTYDRASGRAKHYLNGREVSSEEIVFDQPLTFGTCEIGNWTEMRTRAKHRIRNLNGRIDELTIWNTALTGDEISEIYRKTKP